MSLPDAMATGHKADLPSACVGDGGMLERCLATSAPTVSIPWATMKLRDDPRSNLRPFLPSLLSEAMQRHAFPFMPPRFFVFGRNGRPTPTLTQRERKRLGSAEMWQSCESFMVRTKL